MAPFLLLCGTRGLAVAFRGMAVGSVVLVRGLRCGLGTYAQASPVPLPLSISAPILLWSYLPQPYSLGYAHKSCPSLALAMQPPTPVRSRFPVLPSRAASWGYLRIYRSFESSLSTCGNRNGFSRDTSTSVQSQVKFNLHARRRQQYQPNCRGRKKVNAFP